MSSVTRATRSHRERRATVAQRIADATERLLRDGERFTEIPVERIISSAGVSRSTFYAHYADKTAVLIALAADVGDWPEWWPIGSRDFTEQGIADLIRAYRERRHVLGALDEAASYDEGVRRLRRDQLARRVDRAAERLGSSSTGDARFTAFVVIHMLDATIRDHVERGPADADVAVARALARAAWPMICDPRAA